MPCCALYPRIFPSPSNCDPRLCAMPIPMRANAQWSPRRRLELGCEGSEGERHERRIERSIEFDVPDGIGAGEALRGVLYHAVEARERRNALVKLDHLPVSRDRIDHDEGKAVVHLGVKRLHKACVRKFAARRGQAVDDQRDMMKPAAAGSFAI